MSVTSCGSAKRGLQWSITAGFPLSTGEINKLFLAAFITQFLSYTETDSLRFVKTIMGGRASPQPWASADSSPWQETSKLSHYRLGLRARQRHSREEQPCELHSAQMAQVQLWHNFYLFACVCVCLCVVWCVCVCVCVHFCNFSVSGSYSHEIKLQLADKVSDYSVQNVHS